MKKWSMVMVIMMLATVLAACGGGNNGTTNETQGTGGTTNNVTNNATNTETNEPDATEEPSGDVPTAEELITNIAAASASMESFTMEMVSEQTIDMNGETQNVKTSVKSDIIQNPLTAYQELTMEMPAEAGGNQEMIQYMTPEGMYMQVSGEWIKMAGPEQGAMMEQLQQQASPEAQLEHFKSITNETTVTEEGDNYILTADVSGDNVKELSKNMLEGLGGGADPAGMDQLMDQMGIEKMLIVYTVRKDDYLPVSMNVEMSMTMEQEGMTMKMDNKSESTFSNYNEIDEITVPEEALNAPSMEEMMQQPGQ